MTDNFIKVAQPFVGEEEASAVREVLLSGEYVSGLKVEAFEKAFADYIGTKYAVAVSNGTSALFISLETMGVGQGDEVIVPPLTFFATISSILYLGAIPVFADIDADDLCLSWESVKEKISPRTKAILPVHLFGAPAKMNQLTTIAREKNIPILEDCAQAHGSEYKKRKVGSIGKAGAFSFFATKHMTTGEGGMITTNDPDIANQAKIIRNHGMSGRDGHIRLGFNNRMTEIQAAIGLVQLGKLDQLNQKRIDNSEYILSRLKGLPWITIPVGPSDIKHTYFWCPIMIKEENGKKIQALKDHLTDNEIGFRHRYQEPLYRQPVLKKVGLDYSDIYLPTVEQVAGQVIGLPNHAGLTKTQLDRIVDVVMNFSC
ncbi:MAG: DegT/DnrJ/EryC1/StrS family aminotransferase [Desulfobacula sp.]|jgi:perosamine synthetase|nr:DegT/DnrJ/EryC1/StrS family aminotransferase [Desulfobacula sp.]